MPTETELPPIHETPPEEPPVPEVPEIPEIPPDQPEPNAETEPLRESIDTVAQMMEHWREQYDHAEGPEKQELAHRLVRMGEALALSGLHADQVKIRETTPGILGFYLPATGEIAITPAGLSLPAEHFQDVLVHEATHAGITTRKEIGDEGLAQIVTINKVSGAMPGIYESEQASAREAFAGIGLDRVLDKYDFDRPAELIELYLQTEWHDAWRDHWQTEVGEQSEISTGAERQELLEDKMKDWVERLEKTFEEAAPRLFEKAKTSGFNFDKTHQKLFQKNAEETKVGEEK